MEVVTGPDPNNLHLERLRNWRNRRKEDYSLSFLAKQFKHQIARPHKQIRSVIEWWNKLVPAELLEHTRLESLRRGVLKVSVDSSSRLYELDRLLRSGLEQQIIASYPGVGLCRIQLRVDDTWCERSEPKTAK